MKSQSVMTLHRRHRVPDRGARDVRPAAWRRTTESDSVIEGRHVGACKPGQQPGDMTLPNGQTINIRSDDGRRASKRPAATLFGRHCHGRTICFNTLQDSSLAAGSPASSTRSPALEAGRHSARSRGCPVSIRIVLESGAAQLRRQEGDRGARAAARRRGTPTAARVDEIPFVVARVVLQDFTGVPLLCDLAAMRNVASDLGKNPKVIEPLVPGRPRRRPLGA